MASSTTLQLDKSSWPSQILLKCAIGVKDRQHQKHKHCQLQTTPPMVLDIRLRYYCTALYCSIASSSRAIADILEVRSLGMWICMVLEWTPEEASLLQDRPLSAAVSVYISGEAWETQNHQTFPASVYWVHKDQGTGDFV